MAAFCPDLLYMDSIVCVSITCWYCERSMILKILWSVWNYQLCTTHCMCKEKALSAPGRKNGQQRPAIARTVHTAPGGFLFLAEIKCRLEIVGKQDEFVTVECSSLLSFAGGGQRLTGMDCAAMLY